MSIALGATVLTRYHVAGSETKFVESKSMMGGSCDQESTSFSNTEVNADHMIRLSDESVGGP